MNNISCVIFCVTLQTETISAQLPPNTAVNVTVIGNYTRIRSPYKATLHAFYQGYDEPEVNKVEGNVRKATLLDVKIIYSPIYWLGNGTLVPTSTPPTTTISIVSINSCGRSIQYCPLSHKLDINEILSSIIYSQLLWFHLFILTLYCLSSLLSSILDWKWNNIRK